MNNNIGIIIQARTSSTRLPRKIILKIEKQISFLDVLIERLKKIKFNYPIILATSDLQVDDILEDYANKHEIKFFRGSENDVLQRFIDCAKENNLNSIVRICSDNPFLDIVSIEKLLKNYKGQDYLSLKINNSPSILTHFGFFAEIVSLKALKKIALKKNKDCKEHVTNCIYRNPNEFNITFIEDTIENDNIRCTLDTKEDFEILKEIYLKFIKNNFQADYLDIIKYVETRLDLLNKMKKIIKENRK